MPLLNSAPEGNYRVFLETDEQNRDTGEFLMEMYHHVKAVIPFDKMLMLDLGDGNLYYYNLDHLRSYRVTKVVDEKEATPPTPTQTAFLRTLK